MTVPATLHAIPNGQEPLPNIEPEPVVRSIVDLKRADENDGNTLLGKRFLCRGGGCLFVGSSGIGKSTAIIQMGIGWAVGREIFGIKPSGPLKILYVQAENDEGDICEMRDGVLVGLELKNNEIDLLEKNFVCALEASRTGEGFVNETLGPLLEKHHPDLVIIDPALSYLGGSSNEQETVGRFLRNLLNPLLQKHNCGVLIVHHTNKPVAERNGRHRQRPAHEFAYAGTGSAEWANWARAVLVLEAKDDDGFRWLHIGKRYRLGWLDADGNATFSKCLKQAAQSDGLFYRELSANETAARSVKSDLLTTVLYTLGILPPVGNEISQDELVALITTKAKCGINRARQVAIPLLLKEGYLERKEVPRPRARPEIWFVSIKSPFGRHFELPKTGVETNGVITDGEAVHN